MDAFYAHSKENEPPEQWQKLEDHVHNVASIAAAFAQPFGGEVWAELAGLWHDLGKFNPAFQKKLYDANGIDAHIEAPAGRVVHSLAGGHAATLKGWQGADRLLSWLIMGHHAGLADFGSDPTGAKALEPKMRMPETSLPILKHVPHAILNKEMPSQRIPSGADPAFFIRMLFSCLVDADFLDTEAFMMPGKAAMRSQYPRLITLKEHFDRYLDEKCTNALPTQVNKVRKAVLEQCRCAAEDEPSVFSLTVPTGGGKTLSSMAFALNHAVKHGKARIIYVIPFTSIIEQTVEVFRTIPGFEHAVVEHHSNVIDDEDTVESRKSRLATENWDAPIIVTTAVQFFESLFACKTSRCRKVHNLVNSVIIFDEAQCLPPEYLRPCVFAIRELHRHYGVTPLLCTATQPVLTQTKQFDFSFKEGFESVREIISDPEALSQRLKRVEIVLFNEKLAPIDHETLISALLNETQSVLCIVNRKEDAHQLAKALPEEKTVHLSTNMCAEHRLAALTAIKNRLNTPEPFFVISTSLVEAGVDLDFPVVYRALAGLDSIAQAAGRCNREGKSDHLGKTVVFLPENQPQYVKQPAGIAREALSGDLSAVFSPKTIENYFKKRFWQLGEEKLDLFHILPRLSGRMNYAFRSVSDDFQMIRDGWTLPVVAPYGNALQLIDEMLAKPYIPPSCFLRKLQRYMITIPRFTQQHLMERDYVHAVDGFPGLCTLNAVLYDQRFGFIPLDESGMADPTLFIG